MNTIRHSTLALALLLALAGTANAQVPVAAGQDTADAAMQAEAPQAVDAAEAPPDVGAGADANADADADADADATDDAQAANATSAPQLDPTVPHPAPVHPELKGVFADFGGEAGLTVLMEDFMAIMLEDPRMRPFFEKVDHTRVKRQLVEQFCGILGGGCTYSGRDMKTAHAGLRIDRADFNALVEDLQIAMNRARVPFRSQNKLLAVLAPMHRQMVER